MVDTMKDLLYVLRLEKLLRNFIPVALFFLSLSTFAYFSVPVLSTQDEGAIFASTLSLIYDNDFKYTNQYNSVYETNVIAPSFVSYKSADLLYYNTFFGTSVFFTPVVLFLDSYYYIFFPIIASFSIILIYLISEKIFNSKVTGVFSSLILMFMPIFVMYSVTYFNNIVIVFFYLIAFYIMVLKKISFEKKAILVCLFLSLAIIIRFDQILVHFVYILIFWYLYQRELKMERRWKNFASIFSLGLIFLFITISSISFSASGSIFYSPQLAPYAYIPLSHNEITISDIYKSYNASSIDRVIAYLLGTKTGIYEFSVFDHFNTQWLHIKYLLSATFAFPFIYLSLLGFIYIIFGKKYTFLVIFILLILFNTLLIYGSGREYYGLEQVTLKNAFLRYSLPFFVFSSIPAAYLIKCLLSVNKNSLVRITLASSIFIAVLLISFSASMNPDTYGIERLNTYRVDQLNIQKELSNFYEINDNTLIITGFYTEKHLYPISTNINYEKINNLNYVKNWYVWDYEYLYDSLINQTISLVNNWLENNGKVYFLYRKYTDPAQKTFNHHLSTNFELLKVYENQELIVYSVHKQR